MKSLQRTLRETFGAGTRPKSGAGRKARQLAMPLALANGIEIEKLGGGFNVWPPKDLPPEADPFEGDHYAQDWPDVLQRVQAYVAVIAQGIAPCLQALEPRVRAMLNDSLCNDDVSSDEQLQAHWCAEFGLTAEQAAAALAYRPRCLTEVFYQPFPETSAGSKSAEP